MTDRATKGGQTEPQLDEILGRVKYVGQEPPPSEDETMDMAVDEVRAVRAERGKRRLEERLPKVGLRQRPSSRRAE